jgi:hypothetical protein
MSIFNRHRWLTIATLTGLAWLLMGSLGLLLQAAPMEEKVRGLGVFLVLGLLCLGDLLSLSSLVKILVEIKSEEREKLPERIIRAAIYGTMKVCCLLGIVVVLKLGRSVPSFALIMGVSTLVIVPIISGVIADARAASF